MEVPPNVERSTDTEQNASATNTVQSDLLANPGTEQNKPNQRASPTRLGVQYVFLHASELLYYTPPSFSVKGFTRFSSPRESVAEEGLRGYDREND